MAKPRSLTEEQILMIRADKRKYADIGSDPKYGKRLASHRISCIKNKKIYADIIGPESYINRAPPPIIRKLTNEQVLMIRADKRKLLAIALDPKYGNISVSTVYNIKKRTTYRNIIGPISYVRKRLTDNQVLSIRSDKRTLKEIAKEFGGISISLVFCVKRMTAYGHVLGPVPNQFIPIEEMAA